jgi:hypothetical protein
VRSPDEQLVIILAWVIAGLLAGLSLVWALVLAFFSNLLLPVLGGLVLLGTIWVAYVGVICWLVQRHEEK